MGVAPSEGSSPVLRMPHSNNAVLRSISTSAETSREPSVSLIFTHLLHAATVVLGDHPLGPLPEVESVDVDRGIKVFGEQT